MENLDKLKNEILQKISTAADLKELEDVRISVLGKKGSLTELMKGLGSLSLEEKIAMGKELNLVKNEIENALEKQKSFLAEKEFSFNSAFIFNLHSCSFVHL